MKYIQIDIKLTITDPYSEILIARLDQVNFDSFFEYKNGLKAYIDYNRFDQQVFDNILNDLPADVVSSFSISETEMGILCMNLNSRSHKCFFRNTGLQHLADNHKPIVRRHIFVLQNVWGCSQPPFLKILHISYVFGKLH